MSGDHELTVKVQRSVVTTEARSQLLIYTHDQRFRVQFDLPDGVELPLRSFWVIYLTCAACGHDRVPLEEDCPDCGGSDVFVTLHRETSEAEYEAAS